MKIFYLFIIFLGTFACSSPRLAPHSSAALALPDTVSYHIGFYLVNADTKKVKGAYQEKKYFTPASTAKVLTLYCAAKLLQDSLVGLLYEKRKDSLLIAGVGDPTLLSPAFKTQRVVDFLTKNETPIYYTSVRKGKMNSLGAGWAWEDAAYAFSAERAELPLYHNVVRFQRNGKSWKVTPPRFKQAWESVPANEDVDRMMLHPAENKFYIVSGQRRRSTFRVPFHATLETSLALLSDTLHKKITPIKNREVANFKRLRSMPTDSVFSVMMQDSDNFIAEQLLMQCGWLLTDTLQTENNTNRLLKKYFTDAPDSMLWVDGSGLSRYNLLTPRTLVYVWMKLEKEFSRERVLSWLSVGGKSGTLKKYYISSEPYVFAKTGSLSNQISLTGFLRTKNKNNYWFAFMNNHALQTATQMHASMEKTLQYIYEHY